MVSRHLVKAKDGQLTPRRTFHQQTFLFLERLGLLVHLREMVVAQLLMDREDTVENPLGVQEDVVERVVLVVMVLLAMLRVVQRQVDMHQGGFRDPSLLSGDWLWKRVLDSSVWW